MKFQKFIYWFRWAMILSLISRILLITTKKPGDPMEQWLPLLAVGIWTLFFVGRSLIPVVKRGGWIYKLYRYRSPAGSGQFVHPPHSPGIFERLYLRIRPPRWCRASDDALMIIYRDQDKLLREGDVALGVLVQANSLLFKRGVSTGPANVLYMTEGDVANPAIRLMEIADNIYSLKGTKPDDPDQLKFARMVSYEMGRDFRVSVPASLSNGLDVTYTTIMIHRKHLPYGYLTNIYFPLLVHQESRAAMILPARYWPDEIISDWTPRRSSLLKTEPSS